MNTTAQPGSSASDSNLPPRNILQPTGHDIDTVKLVVGYRADPARLHALDDVRDHYGDDAWLKTTAKHHNLFVAVTESRVSVHNSLAVYLASVRGLPYGNATPFDHDALEPALVDLADVIGVPAEVFLKGRVMKLDVGVNVPVASPVREITDNMIADSGARVMPRGPASTEVGYTTRGLYVYDKRTERGQRCVDPVYGPGPLARVELKLKKDIDRQLGRAVTVASLCDRAFYEHLGERLVQAAIDQPFRRSVRLDPVVQTPTDLYRAYAVSGIEALGGFDAAMNTIDASQRLGVLDKSRASRLRGAVRDLRRSPDLTETLDVAADFRRAVRGAVYTSSH